jgi:Animal haem peroxidase
MFRRLPPFTPADADLEQLAQTMIEKKEEDDEKPDPGDNADIPAGFTYFGQFVDHDLTFDPNSKLQRDNDPDALRNFRTPRFDLDSVYADGPADNPFLYADDGSHLLIGKVNSDQNDLDEEDLPRNSQGRALIGDPRNDEKLIVSQIALAFLKFHNAVLDQVHDFDEARRIVRWHYQWLVIHDFLERIVGKDVVDDILQPDTFVVGTKDGSAQVQVWKANLKFFKWQEQPFIPVEFSVAAYRFGHSMVRGDYALNALTVPPHELDIFSDDPAKDLRGFRFRPPDRVIEWHRFFEFEKVDPERQQTRNIDTKLAFGLSTLPPSVAGTAPFALAERNLKRGKALGLPSGQTVARAMGLPEDLILSIDNPNPERELNFQDITDFEGKPFPPEVKENLKQKFGKHTPLWYYILKEAEILCDGKKLGPVGGRIVAEVFIGLLLGDKLSYLNVVPRWEPKAGAFGTQKDGEFTMVELLRFAGATP